MLALYQRDLASSSATIGLVSVLGGLICSTTSGLQKAAVSESMKTVLLFHLFVGIALLGAFKAPQGVYELVRPWIVIATSVAGALVNGPLVMASARTEAYREYLWLVWPWADVLTFLLDDPHSLLRVLIVGGYSIVQAAPWRQFDSHPAKAVAYTVFAVLLSIVAPYKMSKRLVRNVDASAPLPRSKRPQYRRAVVQEMIPVKKYYNVEISDFTPEVINAMRSAIFKNLNASGVCDSLESVQLALARGCVWVMATVTRVGSPSQPQSSAALAALQDLDLSAFLPEHLRARIEEVAPPRVHESPSSRAEAAVKLELATKSKAPVLPVGASAPVRLLVTVPASLAASYAIDTPELRVVAVADSAPATPMLFPCSVNSTEIRPASPATASPLVAPSSSAPSCFEVDATLMGVTAKVETVRLWLGLADGQGGIRQLLTPSLPVAVLPEHVRRELEGERDAAHDLALLLSAAHERPLSSFGSLHAAALELVNFARTSKRPFLRTFVEQKILGKTERVHPDPSGLPCVLLHATEPTAMWSFPFLRFVDRDLEERFVRSYCTGMFKSEFVLFFLQAMMLVPMLYKARDQDQWGSLISEVAMVVLPVVLLLKKLYTKRFPRLMYVLFHISFFLPIARALPGFCKDVDSRRYLNMFMAFIAPSFYIFKLGPTVLSPFYSGLHGLAMYLSYQTDDTGMCAARGYGWEIFWGAFGIFCSGMLYSRAEERARLAFFATELEVSSQKLAASTEGASLLTRPGADKKTQ